MPEKNNSLEKALKVLDLFITHNSLTMKNIIDLSGYSKGAVQRILVSLGNSHYLYRNEETGKYHLSGKLYLLAQNTDMQAEIINVLDEPAQKLSECLGFSVTVSMLIDYNTTPILRKDAQTTMSLVPRVGDIISPNCCAVGKVLIAYSRNPKGILDKLNYDQRTKNTIIDRKQLEEELERVKALGFAYDDEELAEGLFCVAAPLLDKAGYATCAISVTGYKPKLTARLDLIKSSLKSTITGIERNHQF
ncbi:IclR family transcriptional regulator [Synergistales bacterium]|nr:IclR family transcriptional regulator [Synergistales bacterium]